MTADKTRDLRPDLALVSASASGGNRRTKELRRLEAETYLNLLRIHRELERKVSDLFEREGLRDVTPQQASALMVLFQERRPLRARTLATKMGLSEVTVGRFVKALRSGGWVDRQPDPQDSRAALLRPTKKAYRALPRFIAVSNSLLDAAFAGFAPADIRRIAKTSRRILANLGAAED